MRFDTSKKWDFEYGLTRAGDGVFERDKRTVLLTSSSGGAAAAGGLRASETLLLSFGGLSLALKGARGAARSGNRVPRFLLNHQHGVARSARGDSTCFSFLRVGVVSVIMQVASCMCVGSRL